jgi:hypothetical protein
VTPLRWEPVNGPAEQADSRLSGGCAWWHIQADEEGGWSVRLYDGDPTGEPAVALGEHPTPAAAKAAAQTYEDTGEDPR